jgi:hypothetical protein
LYPSSQIVLVTGDKCVHSPGICLEKTLLLFGHGGCQALGRGPDLKHSLHFIVLYHARPQQFSQFACGEAPGHIHLPQAILGHHIALSFEQVIHACSLDVWNSMGIASHHYPSRESRQLQSSIQHRHLLVHGVLQPSHTARNAYCQGN